MTRLIAIFVVLLGSAVTCFAQETTSLSADDAETLGVAFSLAPGWHASSEPFSATMRDRGVIISFYTELYSAASPAAFDALSARNVIEAKWGELLGKASINSVAAGSADGLEIEWPGSRVERWFRVATDRFLVERCMVSTVAVTTWNRSVRPQCDAQFAAVVLTASTLPPDYRAAEPLPKTPTAEFARIPGGKCDEPSGSEHTKISRLIRRGARSEFAAVQFACWEAASQLGSPDAMVKIGQLFLERDQLQSSEQDRMAGVAWLLVAADRYYTLIRETRDADAKARYQQRVDTVMELVTALKSDRLTVQQFDTAVTQASNWKKSNMRLFR